MKEVKKVENKKPQSKKPNFFKRMWARIKEVVSELKKVSWPSWSKVVKQTAVVLGVVVLFLVVITLFDFGLGQLIKAIGNIKG